MEDQSTQSPSLAALDRSVALPTDQLESVEGWGGASSGLSFVYRPSTLTQLINIMKLAQENGRSITFRAGGNSYGDVAMNDENIVLNLSRMNRILDWDPENGRISVEPGVTLKQLWEYVLEDGWWPPVATGTMHVTIGGMAAVNAHGKNAWKVGGIGDHIYEFDLLLPTGEILTCNREQNSDIFHAAIGGVGMLGCFTSLTLHLKRIYSGLIHVEGSTKPNLSQTLHWFENHLHNSDYLVGWLDAFATGNKLGRSELHRANHLRQDEDPIPHQTMRIPNQQLGENIMGFVPRSILWMFQRPFWNHYGMRYVNSAKFQLAQFRGHHQFQQPHALYHFLLDNFNWRKPFGPGGLIQYQPFVPIENAEEALHKLLVVCQRHRMQNFLSVIKRHKPDPFLLSYQPDGFSMAMDFQITNRNREKVVRLVREMDEIVLAANGRFYFAKDSTVRPQIAQHYLGSKAIDQFKTIKHRCDPNGILESNLWRRVFVS